MRKDQRKAPSSNIQAAEKLQFSSSKNSRLHCWSLELGVSLELGWWCLELSVAGLLDLWPPKDYLPYHHYADVRVHLRKMRPSIRVGSVHFGQALDDVRYGTVCSKDLG